MKDFSYINVEKALEFVLKCQNCTDGAFGLSPELESHGGATFCAVASIKIVERLDLLPY